MLTFYAERYSITQHLTVPESQQISLFTRITRITDTLFIRTTRVNLLILRYAKYRSVCIRKERDFSNAYTQPCEIVEEERYVVLQIAL